MTLRELRCLFTLLKARLVIWINQQGWQVASGEGYVALSDPVPHRGPHKKNGGHYSGLAEDLLLYVNGVYITNSHAPQWVAIGAEWKSYHPLCRWGGDFHNVDGNHISLEYQGVA